MYWRGRHWFFYCSDCKHWEPGLRGTYINGDGHNSSYYESPSPSPRAAPGPRPSGSAALVTQPQPQPQPQPQRPQPVPPQPPQPRWDKGWAGWAGWDGWVRWGGWEDRSGWEGRSGWAERSGGGEDVKDAGACKDRSGWDMQRRSHRDLGWGWTEDVNSRVYGPWRLCCRCLGSIGDPDDDEDGGVCSLGFVFERCWTCEGLCHFHGEPKSPACCDLPCRAARRAWRDCSVCCWSRRELGARQGRDSGA